jgi:pimeloyl-ACP methyl ester carboxylesterase
VPNAGESPDDWWAGTGYAESRAPAGLDTRATFYHDVPAEIADEALRRERATSETPAREPWPLAAWPDVPTRFLLCRDDRLLPAPFLRRVVQERLGIVPDEIDGGHCVALSRPAELAERLDTYALTV